MEGFIGDYLDLYGPLAVFILLMLSGIGIPLGEDVITIPAGLLVGHGELPLWPTLIAAYAGVVCSDLLWFRLCSHYGTPLLRARWFKRVIHPRRLLQAKHQFEARGIWFIVMSRFIPTTRTYTITTAGLLHMPFWRFALTTMCCVLVSAPLQIGLGMLVASGLGKDNPNLILSVIGLAVLVVATITVARWIATHRRSKERVPRAKAAWLRSLRRGAKLKAPKAVARRLGSKPVA